MEPSLDTPTIFFLVAAIQGLFLSIMIFLRKSRTNNLLGFLILFFSLVLLYYVSFWTRYEYLFPRHISILQGLTFSFGPLLYFYVRSGKKEAYFNFWHFIPQLLYFVYFFGFRYIPREYFATVSMFRDISQNAHLIIYTFLIFQFTWRNKGFTNGALKLYQWRKKLSLAFLGYSLSFVTYYTLVWTGTIQVEYDYMVSVASTFFIYFIGYHGFQQQEVFKQYEAGRYEKSSLSDTASAAILKSLRDLMNKEKVYQDSSLRLQDLAQKLEFPPHYISQVINDLDGKNFADFINEYRVEEAKKKLLDSDRKKIIDVAYSCGFNNKTSFSSAFKRFTGMSATEFRENHLTPA
ncbi:MAG: helix-turn-helix domain-containing protein [Cyclobacteriaceae bacterium]